MSRPPVHKNAMSPAERQRRYRQRKKRMATGAKKRERRAARERELAEATKRAAAELGCRVYGVLYADPPWPFEFYSQATGTNRSPENHYPTMTLDQIAQLPVPAADDCALFLWVTGTAHAGRPHGHAGLGVYVPLAHHLGEEPNRHRLLGCAIAMRSCSSARVATCPPLLRAISRNRSSPPRSGGTVRSRRCSPR